MNLKFQAIIMRLSGILLGIVLSASAFGQQIQSTEIDLRKKNRDFLFEAAEQSTPTLRAYIRENGSAYTSVSNLGGVFYFASNATDEVGLGITNTAYGVDYLEWTLETSDTLVPGEYFAQIIVTNDAGSIQEWVRGEFEILESPGTSSSSTWDWSAPSYYLDSNPSGYVNQAGVSNNEIVAAAVTNATHGGNSETGSVSITEHGLTVVFPAVTDTASLQSQITSNDTDVSSLQLQVSSNDTDIASALAQISSNDTDIAGLQLQVSSNDTDISSLQLQVSSNDTELAGLGTASTNASGDFYLAMNPDGYIDNTVATLTELQTIGDSGEAEYNIDLASGVIRYGSTDNEINLATRTLTVNGLYTVPWSVQGTATLTNHIVNLGTLQAQGYVDETVTNGILASAYSADATATNEVSSWVEAQGYGVGDVLADGSVPFTQICTISNITISVGTINGTNALILTQYTTNYCLRLAP